MNHYAGIDVSLECSSVCVVDASGKIVREGKVASEPEALIGWFGSLGLEAGADRAGGGAAIAMAVCGDAAGGACGRAFGDAARARCLQGDAGEDGPQGRARDRPTDAAGLVPPGALQVDGGAGDAGDAHRAQAGAVEAARRRDEPARHPARVRAEGRQDHDPSFAGRIHELVAGHSSLETSPRRCCGARRAAARVQWLREAGARHGAPGRAGQAADVDAGGRPDRGAHLCVRHRRSGAVQVVEAGGSAFRADAEEVSVRRDRLHRPDQQDRRRGVRTALYEAAHVILTRPIKGCARSRAGPCGSPSAPA